MRQRRPGFTLIELIVAMSIVLILGGIAYASYLGQQQKARDAMAVNLADQVATNLTHYMGWTGAYPVNQASVTWSGLMTAMGTYAEFPTTEPTVFASGSGAGFLVYTNAAGSTFQIEFEAGTGTGTVYCRDANGLATLSAWSATGPWSGCP